MGNQPSSSGFGGGNGGGNGGGTSSGGIGNRRRSSGASNNNAPSSGPSTSTPITFRLPQFSTGSLKLSRSELDRRCTPSGLYPTTPWDTRTVRKLIGDGRLAARLPGHDSRHRSTDQECPICFLHYAQVNITRCCNAAVCTECYLQVRPQKDRNAPCPFCNCPRVTVRVAKLMTGPEVVKRDQEEQRVIEAQIAARKSGTTGESSSGAHIGAGQNIATMMEEAPSTPQPYRTEQEMQSTTTTPTAPSTTPPVSMPRPGEFGSALNRHRSESFASSDGGAGSTHTADGSLTLTPTQRSQIHAQLQSQNDHPLALQMAEEARLRREENEREYFRTHSGRLLERYEEYQRRARQSRAMADRMLLRAHGIPTRGDSGFGLGGSAGGGGPGGGAGGAEGGAGVGGLLAPRNDDREGGGSGGGGGGGFEDLMVIEAALMLSMEEEAERRRRAARGEGGGGGVGGDGGGEGGGGSGDGGAEDNADNDGGTPRDLDQPSLLRRATVSGSGGGTGGSQSTSSRRRLLRSRGRAPSSTHIGTAGMLMRGISEDDQLAMAIALSLREAEAAGNQNQTAANADDDGDGGNDGDGGDETTAAASAAAQDTGDENDSAPSGGAPGETPREEEEGA